MKPENKEVDNLNKTIIIIVKTNTQLKQILTLLETKTLNNGSINR